MSCEVIGMMTWIETLLWTVGRLMAFVLQLVGTIGVIGSMVLILTNLYNTLLEVAENENQD
jgi:hypothetical protein